MPNEISFLFTMNGLEKVKITQTGITRTKESLLPKSFAETFLASIEKMKMTDSYCFQDKRCFYFQQPGLEAKRWK